MRAIFLLTESTFVYTILPTWLISAQMKQITIEQLLTHSSGLGSFKDESHILNKDEKHYA